MIEESSAGGLISANASRGVCSVATTKKRVKILDFKLFYKHFVFVDKGNFDIKKVLKKAHRCKCICRYRLRIGKMNTTIKYLSKERTIEYCSPFFIFRRENDKRITIITLYCHFIFST